MNPKEIIDMHCNEQGIVQDSDGMWSNDNPRFDFDSFRCYWCLGRFKTSEERDACNCDKTGIPKQMVR